MKDRPAAYYALIFAGMLFILLWTSILCCYHVKLKEIAVKNKETFSLLEPEKIEQTTKKRTQW